MNLYKIYSSITSKPSIIQIAKDGKWETPRIIDLNKNLPGEVKIQNYLDEQSFETLAIEILFEQKEGVYILGLVYNSNLLMSSPLSFLQFIINQSVTYSDFKNLLLNLDHSLIGKSYLLQGEPEIIRIGIINHWFSVGICDIWSKGNPKMMTKNILKEKLSEKHEVSETKLNYQGMAFLMNLDGNPPGLRHWLKSPCSQKVENIWNVDYDMMLKYLKDWGNFKIN